MMMMMMMNTRTSTKLLVPKLSRAAAAAAFRKSQSSTQLRISRSNQSAFSTAPASPLYWSISRTAFPSLTTTMATLRRYKSSSAAPAAAAASSPYEQSITQPFPSLIVSSDAVVPVGTFAETQAVYLQPDETTVQELTDLLRATNSGIVAHYYMDVELQGVLQAVGQKLPGRVGIADSLKMGDMAVDMVSNYDCQHIVCLGVDFMSESVSAILAKNGFDHTPVYRAAQAKIGCSLAESAEQTAYRAWLQQESDQANAALHVVYINTSLETKAVSNSLVPTITCTSSNVLQTLLTASAQIKAEDNNLKILYGPDTYMGHNLVTLLTELLQDEESWTDDKIAADLHPQHNRATLQQLRDNIVVFPSGNCVVHHMFGAQVVDTVKANYDDAYVTAHLEVPGEMFGIAMQKSLRDEGVVGSTSDILKFISRKVQEAAAASSSSNKKDQQQQQRLKFILGTEAGMVTSIVSSVQAILASSDASGKGIQAEIIFPVASEAVMATDNGSSSTESGMALVPGVAGGEGCSTSGGCATCPFMKMNHLDAVIDVLEMVQSGDKTDQLQRHLPPDRLRGKLIAGRPAMDVGTEPIVYMREFSKNQRLPDELVQRVMKSKQ